jgi:hypothetical protein
MHLYGISHADGHYSQAAVIQEYPISSQSFPLVIEF